MRRSAVAWCVVVAIAFALGISLGRSDSGPAGWREAGPLSAPRSHLTALMLASEDILVFGGLDPGRPEVVLPNAEVLDPRTGGVRVLDGEPLPRIDASANALPSGLVVVAGGSHWFGSDWAQVAVTEIFDPWTKRWRESTPMHDARADHGATVLSDGRVMVAGGHRGIRMLNSVEIFDPRTERWSLVASLPRPRAQFSMATLPNGQVLVAGGLETGGGPSRTSLLYNPGTNLWRVGPPLSVERVLHATISLPSGDVLLVAGQRAAAGSAERYDFRAGRFVYAGSLQRPRMLPQTVALSDGRVVVAGGIEPFAGAFLPTPSVEVWDPETNLWAPGPEVEESSAFGGMVAVNDEVWLIAGAGEHQRALARVTRLRLP